MTDGEQRVVHEERARADGNRINLRPVRVRVPDRRPRRQLGSHPRRRRDAAIQARRGLEHDEWTALANRGDERLIQPRGVGAPDTGLDRDAVIAEDGEAASANQRIGILHRRHDSADARRNDPLRARARSAGVHARLERAVQRGAARTFPGLIERQHLRVRLSGPLVRSITHDDVLVGDDAGAYERIWRRAAEAAARELERPPHPPLIHLRQGFGGHVLYHFSWNSAST
jgi:hypothetical protein